MSKVQEVKREQPILRESLQHLHDFVQEMAKGEIQSFCMVGYGRDGSMHSVFYHHEGKRAPLLGALEFAKNHILNYEA